MLVLDLILTESEKALRIFCLFWFWTCRSAVVSSYPFLVRLRCWFWTRPNFWRTRKILGPPNRPFLTVRRRSGKYFAAPWLNRQLPALNGIHFAWRVVVLVIVQTGNFGKFNVKAGYLGGILPNIAKFAIFGKISQLSLCAAPGRQIF